MRYTLTSFEVEKTRDFSKFKLLASLASEYYHSISLPSPMDVNKTRKNFVSFEIIAFQICEILERGYVGHDQVLMCLAAAISIEFCARAGVAQLC